MKTIHCNHLGFRPDDPIKRALMPIAPGEMGLLGGHIFQVIEMSRFVRHRLDSPENLACLHLRAGRVEETPLGRFAVCDLSDLTARGGYQIVCDDARSYPFLIQRDVWQRCFRILLEWYRAAACGESVPGYHEACHLDDCRLRESGKQVDLVGGWHDAGDLRKWTSTMATVSGYLAEFVAQWGGELDDTGVDDDLVSDQLCRGAEYLLKTVDPETHLVWHSIAAAGDNTCNEWTDNAPDSGDERLAETDQPLPTAAAYVQAQCALSRVLRPMHWDLAEACTRSAHQVWEALRPRLVAEGDEDAILACAIDLWRATTWDRYRDIARQALNAILDRQVLGAAFGQDALRGYFVRDGHVEGNAGFKGRGGRNMALFMRRALSLADAIVLWREDPDRPRWRDALQTLLEGCVEPMLKLHPYRAMPSCVFDRASADVFGRPLAGDLCFRYFALDAEGNNFELANAAASLGTCAWALEQRKWAAWGQKQLEWIYGFNPHEVCMMTGLGYSNAAVFSFYVGQIPGAIINGYLGSETDEPVLCMNREVSPMNMEYWSVHTAAVLRALAILENQTLA